VNRLVFPILLLLAPGRARADDRLDNENEPTVEELRAAARRHAGLEPGRARGWARRARLAGLVPQLTLRLLRSFERDEGVTSTSAVDRLDVDLGNDLVLEGRATWDLGRLVFDPAELRAAREGARLRVDLTNLEAEVTRLYFQRRRAQVEMVLNPPADPTEETRRRLDLEELGAQIDTLTGGALTRALEEGR
jgi:hypothetical protein